MKITYEIVRKRLNYDPCSGVLVWKRIENPSGWEIRFNDRHAGKRAGIKGTRGYRYISIYGSRKTPESWVVWLYVNGTWPKNEIDHINGDPSDNRIANLREATSSQNKVNRRAQCTNKSGIKGVRFKKGKWLAAIKINGRQKHLGSFNSSDEASFVFRQASISIHGEFAKI